MVKTNRAFLGSYRWDHLGGAQAGVATFTEGGVRFRFWLPYPSMEQVGNEPVSACE